MGASMVIRSRQGIPMTLLRDRHKVLAKAKDI